MFFFYRFKDLLRSRLYECGWVDQVHMLCRQASRNQQLTVNELYDEVAQKGRGILLIFLLHVFCHVVYIIWFFTAPSIKD